MQTSWEKHVWKSRLSGQVRVLDHGVLKIVWRCLKQGVPDWPERLQTISGVVVGRNGWKTSESNMRDGLMGLGFGSFWNLFELEQWRHISGFGGDGNSPTEFTTCKAAHDTWGKTTVLTGEWELPLDLRYSQAPWRGRLWNASFLSRLLLNKLLPSVPQSQPFDDGFRDSGDCRQNRKAMQKCHQTCKLQHLRQGVVEGWLELFSVSQTGLDSFCERTGLGETQRYAPYIW